MEASAIATALEVGETLADRAEQTLGAEGLTQVNLNDHDTVLRSRGSKRPVTFGSTETLTLMISFGTLVVIILSFHKRK